MSGHQAVWGSLLPFLVIDQAAGLHGQLVATLSPRVMRWSERCWLVDLRPTRFYWTAQAQRRGVSAAVLLQTLMEAETATSCEGQEGQALLPPLLVFADDLWQGILLTGHLVERGLSGLLELKQPFSLALMRQLSWPVWFAAARLYAAAAKLTKAPGFKEPQFYQHLARLEKTVMRLGQHHPAQMANAGEQAFRRRFGEQVALLWRWTTQAVPSELQTQRRSLGFDEDLVFASAFPWTSWEGSAKILVTRHLDYAVWTWDQLAEDLAADFAKLGRLLAATPAPAVIHIAWMLQLEDLSTRAVPIRFRHPHNLQAEHEAGYKTALIQASLSFHAVYGRNAAEATDEPPVALIGWSLVAEERLAEARFASALFADLAPSGDVQRIDNQLPIALERYVVCQHWVPEAMYALVDAEQAGEPVARPWLSLAAVRPLYLYPEPRRLGPHEKSHSWTFLERVGGLWWQEEGPSGLERNYYLLTTPFGQRCWGVKSDSGEWLVHGIFA